MHTKTLPIDIEMASRIRLYVRQLLDDLDSILTDPRYADAVGLHAAVAAVVDRALDLDARLPENGLALLRDPPSLRRSSSVDECPIPIKLPLDAARDLVAVALTRSSELNSLLGEIQLMIPTVDRGTLVAPFAHLMGYLYTELMRPLHFQHPELEPLILGPTRTQR